MIPLSLYRLLSLSKIDYGFELQELLDLADKVGVDALPVSFFNLMLPRCEAGLAKRLVSILFAGTRDRNGVEEKLPVAECEEGEEQEEDTDVDVYSSEEN